MKSLRNRLLLMPVMMVGIVCAAILLLFNIAVGQFVENEVEQSIKSFKEYNLAMDNLEDSLEDIEAYSSSSGKTREKIRSEMELLEQSYAKEKNSVTTQMVVLDDEEYLKEFATDTEKKLVSYYWKHEDEISSDAITEAKLESGSYCISTARFKVHEGREKADVLIYTSISTLNGFIGSVNKVLLMTIAISALVSILLGFLITKSITGAIITLKEFISELREGEVKTEKEDMVYEEFVQMADVAEGLTKEVQESQKLQKMIFQNASHELRTPLMSIQGYAEGISTNVLKNHQAAADIIITESKKMSGLVDEMLYISRMDENPITEDDMTLIELRQIIEYCREEVCVIGEKKGVVIIESLDGGKYFIKGDEKQITKAISNVMTNGIRYAEEKLAISGSVQDGKIILTVTDDGKGISENDLPHIFERFYKGEGGNIGIGLAITKDIVERHGGTISAYNMDKGARFMITLPAVRVEEEEEKPGSGITTADDAMLKAVIDSIPEEDRLI